MNEYQIDIYNNRKIRIYGAKTYYADDAFTARRYFQKWLKTECGEEFVNYYDIDFDFQDSWIVRKSG